MEERKESQSVSEVVDSLVARYREGDVEAGAELIRMFQPMINKYVQLCLSGRVDPHDWVQCKVLKGVHPDLHTAGQIIKQRMATVHKDDIWLDAILSLLQAALNWSNLSIGFRNLFLRRVLRHVRRTSHEVYESDILDSSEIEESLYSKQSAVAEDLDELWVLGLTAGPGFDELSAQERYILYLAYWVGLSDTAIAERLNVSLQDARELRRLAIQKAEIYLKRSGRL